MGNSCNVTQQTYTSAILLIWCCEYTYIPTVSCSILLFVREITKPMLVSTVHQQFLNNNLYFDYLFPVTDALTLQLEHEKSRRQRFRGVNGQRLVCRLCVKYDDLSSLRILFQPNIAEFVYRFYATVNQPIRKRRISFLACN